MKTEAAGRFWGAAGLLALLLAAGCWVPIRPVDPPGPPPGPDIPVVVPVVDEIKTGPIAVLILEETADRLKPEADSWRSIVDSVQIKAYLDSHCSKDSNGNPNWRIWDADKDRAGMDPLWREAMALPRDSLPWIAITNGAKGVSGPLPGSEAEVLALLKKWGGP